MYEKQNDAKDKREFEEIGDVVRDVLLYGKEEQGGLFDRLSNFFAEQAGTRCRSQQMLCGGNGKGISLYQLDHLKYIVLPHGVLWLQTKGDFKSVEDISVDTTVIMSSANRLHLKLLSKFSLNVISCGLSGKDTLTFSSKREDAVVVSLQRSITTLVGTTMDPMEIPCRIVGKYRDYALLGEVAIRLLCGKIGAEKDGFLHIDFQT